MTKKHWVWLMGAATVLIIIGVSGWLFFRTPSSQIVRGVAIGSIEVGGLDLSQAKALLQARLTDLPLSLTLVTPAGSRQVNCSELMTGFDLDRSLAEALAVGRGDGLWRDLQTQWRLRQSSVSIPLHPLLSERGLDSVHRRLIELYELPSRAASLAIQGSTVTVLPSQNGRTVERDNLERAVRQALERLETEVVVELKEIKASPSTEELTAMGIKEKVAEFSSTFSVSLAGRVHNIRTAARALDGQIVAPGQIFSFNDVVGPADASDGYQEAIVISNGEYTTGVGGGVCQVSSTLYGAVLRANLKISERHNHSLIVTYVPPALDATVNYPAHDFCFENNAGSHLLIKAETVGDQIIVRLYGQRDRTLQVQVESQVIETYPAPARIIPDDTLPVGQEEVVQNGSVGYLAVAFRKVYKDGILVQTEKLSQDYYSPSTRVVRAGTKPNPVAAPTQPQEPAVPRTIPAGTATPNPAPSVGADPSQGEKMPN